MADLNVELYGELVGTLDGGGAFHADPAAIARHGLGSTILSRAIPLGVSRSNSRSIARNFFAELLPEGDLRNELAALAGLSPDDLIGMLRVYGRDVAGAVQIWDPTLPGEPKTPAIEPVDELEIERMLAEVSTAPLGNVPRRGKSSLAGVQNKIVLVRTQDGWARALDGYPSTHIIKPIVPRRPTVIFDEEYGARFARRMGLADFETSLATFGDTAALIIERYDRDGSAPTGRIHQEDFNQILGKSGREKYEKYRGAPLRSVARDLNRRDRVRLMRMVVLSVALGNLDMHLKNISLVHDPDGTSRLAPMYDVVPQAFHLDLDGEMALAVGGEFSHRLLTTRHLETEFAQWGIRAPMKTITGALEEILSIASAERPSPGAQSGLQHLVMGYTANLLEGRAVGDAGDGEFDPATTGSVGVGGWRWDNPQHEKS